MRIEIHHYHHADKKTRQKLDAILQQMQLSAAADAAILHLLRDIRRKEVIILKEMDDLETQVTGIEAVDQSAVTLIQGIAAQLADAKTDPVKIQALSDRLNASATALAAAITANTPAAPEAAA
jgi:hypothetical protein